jgi:UDP-2,4-diacetamido-2,4,6-trideoxy-beta-L-altropyranose hydrolase
MRSNRELPPLLVRADADATQGTGHVMRCLALAQEWCARGGSVRFVSARPSPRLSRRIQSSGATLIEIEQAHPNFADLDSTVRSLEQLQRGAKSPAWVVLDGYHFDNDFQRQLRRAGCRLLVIDDNNHLPRYDADIVLNHGIRAPRLDYRASDDAWFLLGTGYALLRAEFVQRRGFKRDVKNRAKNILITLGGGDADNVTHKVIGAVQQLGELNLEIQVLVGALNPHREELRQFSRASQNIRLQSDVTDTTG